MFVAVTATFRFMSPAPAAVIVTFAGSIIPLIVTLLPDSVRSATVILAEAVKAPELATFIVWLAPVRVPRFSEPVLLIVIDPVPLLEVVKEATAVFKTAVAGPAPFIVIESCPGLLINPDD